MYEVKRETRVLCLGSSLEVEDVDEMSGEETNGQRQAKHEQEEL